MHRLRASPVFGIRVEEGSPVAETALSISSKINVAANKLNQVNHPIGPGLRTVGPLTAVGAFAVFLGYMLFRISSMAGGYQRRLAVTVPATSGGRLGQDLQKVRTVC